MRHLKLTLLVVLLLFSSTVMAQSRIYLEPRLGYGNFQMKSMKELQQSIISRSGVNAKATDTFGPYFQYGLSVVTDLDEKARAGVFVERGSTGGRVAYKDYSGELQFDNLVSYNAVGAQIYSHMPIRNSQVSFVSGIEASVLFSRLRMEGYSRLYNTSESSEEKFNSTGIGLKPFVGLQYPILNIPASLTLGYLASRNGPFHVPGERDQVLVRDNNTTDNKLEPGWNGLRINLTVSVPLFN